MPAEGMNKRILFGIIALGFAVRLAMLCAVPASGVQTWEYEDIANSILTGNGYQTFHLGCVHYSQAPPLYVFLCVVIYLFTGHSHLAVQFVQIVLSCGIGFAVYKIARLMCGEKTSLAAAFAAISHPGLLMYSVVKLHPLTLDTLLILSVLYCVLRSRTNTSVAWGMVTGCITGLAALSRPTIMLFLPFAAIWLFAAKGIDKRKVFVFCFAVLAVVTAVISPWIIRNFIVHKQIVFITTDTGELLWRGNNPAASGSAYAPSGELVVDKMPDALAARIYTSPELEQAKLFQREALVFIKHNPGAAVRLFISKFYYFWWFAPQSGILYPSAWLIFYRFYYGILVLFAAAGAFMILRSGKNPGYYDCVLLLLLMLSIGLAQCIFYVEGRHRWTIEPLIIIFAANGFFSLTRRNARAGSLS
jgi:4-amino-4-deoxy-L-arabinose transferase-like glycosyltransferase